MHVIRNGTKEDIEKVEQFLLEVKISTDGLEENIEYFVLIEDMEGSLVATLGIEAINQVGILRSMVIKSGIKEEELLTIFQHVYKLAVDKKLSTLYLSTNKEQSIPLFQMIGFHKVEKAHLPKEFEDSVFGKQLLTYQQVIFMEKVMS